MVPAPTVAIIGRPNVGKSSLFNRLAGRRQAITDASSGTTRDTISATIEWGGRSFTLIDSAGIETAGDDIGRQAQAQLVAAVAGATVVVVVVEAGTLLVDADYTAAKIPLRSHKPVILAINKSDMAAGTADFDRLGIPEQVRVSAVHGRGSGDLLDLIVARLGRKRAAKTAPVITLALLGRPNVGKSSLMNTLGGTDRAIVSSVPGTTRDVTELSIEHADGAVRVLDTAGLRRRGKIVPGVERFSTERTAEAIAQADVCAVILDASELGTAGDQHIAGMVKDGGKGLILVVNKWDLIEKEDKTQDRLARRLARDFAFAPWAPLVFASATTGLHTTELLRLTHEIHARQIAKVPTPQLNRLLGELLSGQPPAARGRYQPKINYITQTGIIPPTFQLFASHPDAIHFSYKRYLENGLRRAFDFTGTPIRLDFKSKYKE